MRLHSLLLTAILAPTTLPIALPAQSIVPPGTIQLPKDGSNGGKPDAEVAALIQQGLAFAHESKWQQAEAAFSEALKQRPGNGQTAEMLADVEVHLYSASTGEEKLRHEALAKALFELAAKDGNNSPHVQVMRDQLSRVAAPGTAPDTPATQALKEGDRQLNQGDPQGALTKYQQAMRLDPKLYEAPLFAGDAYFKMKQFSDAADMYSKAVAIDPNRDVAYRFWGDALMQSGKLPEAEDKIIEGILCSPYTRSTWAYLEGWAKTAHKTLASPAIKTPALPAIDPSKPGNVNITVAPTASNDPNASAWMVYQIMLAGAMAKPKDGKAARHSLEIEAAALRAALKTAQDNKTAGNDPSFAALAALEKDGMLESWILLNHADEGISHDYAAYREAHRALMHAYIAKYVVHG